MTGRILTRDQIRALGLCGYGHRPGDTEYCGQPSDPAAPCGWCTAHAAEDAAAMAWINNGETP